MKTRGLVRIALVVGVMVSLAVANIAMAQGLPGSGWWTGTQIQNVSGSAALVNVSVYDSTSAANFSTDHNIPAGGAITLLPDALGVTTGGFMGSGVVSSDQELRAIVNVTNRNTGALGIAGGLAAGQYQGSNAGSTSLAFPLVKNNHFGKTTSFYIQNAGAAAAPATAVFVLPSGVYTYTSPSIDPGKMVTFNPTDARNAGNTAPPTGNGVVGSLTVTSAQAVAGVVLEHATVENPATIVQATRGFASSEAGTTTFAPIIKNNFFNRFTGLQVQNVSGGAINIQVTYQAIAGGACPGGSFVDNANGVAAGASATFVHLAGSTSLPAGCLASATVVGTGNVLAMVNESYTSGFLASNPGRAQESTTYHGIPSASTTTRVSVPLYKEDSFNKGTGLQVQNVGGATANVVLTFTGPTGTYVSQSQSIPAGGSLTFIDMRKKAAGFWNGTALTPAAIGCTGAGGEAGNICGSNGVFGVMVTSDQPIAAIANESTYPNTAPRISQDKNNYEGFNLAP